MRMLELDECKCQCTREREFKSDGDIAREKIRGNGMKRAVDVLRREIMRKLSKG